MKGKIIIFVALILVMGGCSKVNDVTSINIKSSSNIIDNKLKNMETISEDILKDTYGMSFSSIDEYIIKENEDGDMYAIIKSNNIDETKKVMDEYFEKVRNFNQAYSPERLEILDNRCEKEIGSYLVYIVAESAEDIYNELIDKY